MRGQRLILVGSTLLMCVGSAGFGVQARAALRPDPPANVQVWRFEEPPRCEEDMPCWDCASMGNGICGLTPTENAAELLESTTHNGQANLPATH